ncbi:hypothetical protein NPIL_156281, partial [Nephila pilipes]
MEEKHLAVQAGEVGGNGIPMLAVTEIVGFRTKKVLYMAVRNRYCMVCSRAAAVNKLLSKHCYCENWHGSSSSME